MFTMERTGSLKSLHCAPATSIACSTPTSGPHPAKRSSVQRKGYELKCAHPGDVSNAGADWVRQMETGIFFRGCVFEIC
jgi:hypothetical protein